MNEQTLLEHKQLNLENNVCFNDILDRNITLTELKSIRKEMKCKKSPGPDPILNEMIKYGS